MASRWILTSCSNSTLLPFLSIILACSILISCGTARESTERGGDDQPQPTEPTAETGDGLTQELIAQVNANRSSLDDVYATLTNEIPPFFKQESKARDIGDPNEGYRVQILSTRTVNYADSVANDFRFWAAENFDKYKPKVYVLFRQPYYKVHIGNFQFHDQAMKLNQFLKEKYPDAWVVHDEVEPNLVPPDSVQYGKDNSYSN